MSVPLFSDRRTCSARVVWAFVNYVPLYTSASSERLSVEVIQSGVYFVRLIFDPANGLMAVAAASCAPIPKARIKLLIR
jgi:hypothetical protein